MTQLQVSFPPPKAYVFFVREFAAALSTLSLSALRFSSDDCKKSAGFVCRARDDAVASCSSFQRFQRPYRLVGKMLVDLEDRLNIWVVSLALGCSLSHAVVDSSRICCVYC